LSPCPSLVIGGNCTPVFPDREASHAVTQSDTRPAEIPSACRSPRASGSRGLHGPFPPRGPRGRCLIMRTLADSESPAAIKPIGVDLAGSGCSERSSSAAIRRPSSPSASPSPCVLRLPSAPPRPSGTELVDALSALADRGLCARAGCHVGSRTPSRRPRRHDPPGRRRPPTRCRSRPRLAHLPQAARSGERQATFDSSRAPAALSALGSQSESASAPTSEVELAAIKELPRRRSGNIGSVNLKTARRCGPNKRSSGSINLRRRFRALPAQSARNDGISTP